MVNDPTIAVQGLVRLCFHSYDNNHRTATAADDRGSRVLAPIALNIWEAVLELHDAHQYVTICKPRVPLNDERPGAPVTAPVQLPNVFNNALALNYWGAVLSGPGMALVTFNLNGPATVQKMHSKLLGDAQLKLIRNESDTGKEGRQEASFKLAKSCWVIASSGLNFELWKCEPNDSVLAVRGALASMLQEWSQPQYPHFSTTVRILDCVFDPTDNNQKIYILVAHLHKDEWKELVLEVEFWGPTPSVSISRVLAVPAAESFQNQESQIGFDVCRGGLHFLGEEKQALTVVLPGRLCILYLDSTKDPVTIPLSHRDNSCSMAVDNSVYITESEGLVCVTLDSEDLPSPNVSKDLITLSRDLALPPGFEVPLFTIVLTSDKDTAVSLVISQLLSGLVPLYGVDAERSAEPIKIEDALKLLNRLAAHFPELANKFTNALQKLRSFIAAKALAPEELSDSLDPVAESTFLAAASHPVFVPAMVEGIAVAASSFTSDGSGCESWFQSRAIQSTITNLKLSAGVFIDSATTKSALLLCEGLSKIKVATDDLAAQEQRRRSSGEGTCSSRYYKPQSSQISDLGTSSGSEGADQIEEDQSLSEGGADGERPHESDDSLDIKIWPESNTRTAGFKKLDAYSNESGITDESNSEEVEQIWSSDDDDSDFEDFDYDSDVENSITMAVYGELPVAEQSSQAFNANQDHLKANEQQAGVESDPDYTDQCLSDSECAGCSSPSSCAASERLATPAVEALAKQHDSQWLSCKEAIDEVLNLTLARLVQLHAHRELLAMIRRRPSLETLYARALAAAALSDDLVARGALMEMLSNGAYNYAEALFDAMMSSGMGGELFSEELAQNTLFDLRLRYLRTSPAVSKVAIEAAQYLLTIGDITSALKVLRQGLESESDEHRVLMLAKMLHKIGRSLDIFDIVYEAEFYAIVVPAIPGLRTRRDLYWAECASKDERVLLSFSKLSCPIDCYNLAIALLVLPTDRFMVTILLRLAHKAQSSVIQRLTLQALVAAGDSNKHLLDQVFTDERVVFVPPDWSSSLGDQEIAELCAHMPKRAHQSLVKVFSNLTGACATRLRAHPALEKELTSGSFRVLKALD